MMGSFFPGGLGNEGLAGTGARGGGRGLRPQTGPRLPCRHRKSHRLENNKLVYDRLDSAAGGPFPWHMARMRATLCPPSSQPSRCTVLPTATVKNSNNTGKAEDCGGYFRCLFIVSSTSAQLALFATLRDMVFTADAYNALVVHCTGLRPDCSKRLP